MNKISNKENISTITMRPFAECLCAIGKDWYHIDFEVYFEPSTCYPDYMQISDFVSQNISGKELNIEQAVAILGDMLYREYSPNHLYVTGTVDKVVTHFPVEVCKEYCQE